MIAIFDLLEVLMVVVFLYLALSQMILPAIRGTQWFPALHPHARVLQSERRHVLTDIDHSWQQLEVKHLRKRLTALEEEIFSKAQQAPPTDAPKGQEDTK